MFLFKSLEMHSSMSFRSGDNKIAFMFLSDGKVLFLRLSSEDSEETSAYFYDSDGSGEIGITQQQGEMDLLGEILDTLSTHSSDQGKLSGAKSLDFFRSMDDIDYKTAVSLLLSFENQPKSVYNGILHLWNEQHSAQTLQHSP